MEVSVVANCKTVCLPRAKYQREGHRIPFIPQKPVNIRNGFIFGSEYFFVLPKCWFRRRALKKKDRFVTTHVSEKYDFMKSDAEEKHICIRSIVVFPGKKTFASFLFFITFVPFLPKHKADSTFHAGVQLQHGPAVFRHTISSVTFHCPHPLSCIAIDQLNCNEVLLKLSRSAVSIAIDAVLSTLCKAAKYHWAVCSPAKSRSQISLV